MKNALALLIGAVATGAGFAGATHFMHSASDNGLGEEAVSPEFDLVSEMRSLRNVNAHLEDRILILERIRLEQPREPATTASTEFEDEVRQWMARIDADRPAIPVLLTDVKSALSTIRQEERQADRLRWLEKQANPHEQRLKKLMATLDLTTYQVDEMRAFYERRSARAAEIKRAWALGGEARTIGDMQQTNARTDRQDLETILTPSQLVLLDATGVGK